MDDLPIDIHSNKLLDWLITRRQCKKNWQDLVTPIREKIGHALKDMPENDEIIALLRASYINYFHCKEIVEILKETEKDTKNVFGYYSSQRMKDWQEIILLYEKDSAYLAEAAHFLQRFVQYEIPMLRKQISKAESGIKEAERKEEDFNKQSANSRRNYEKELQKLGIDGANLRAELLALTAELPTFLREIGRQIHDLSPAIDYYDAFRRYTSCGSAIIIADKCLPVLRNVIKRFPDEVTYYEWKYGEIPENVEKFQLDQLEETTEKEEEIDFGDDEIDFGDEPEVDQVSGSDDFKIEVIDEVKKEVITKSSKVARGPEALSVMEHAETFPIILAELAELKSFFDFRRIDELAETAADIYLSGIENKPQDLLSVKVSTIDEWIAGIGKIYSALLDPQKSQLFKIRSSPVFVDELICQLEQKRLLEHKYRRMAELMTEKQKDCSKQVVNSQELLETMIESTKTLQENLESDISRRYNDREVYIMGEINAVLYG